MSVWTSLPVWIRMAIGFWIAVYLLTGLEIWGLLHPAETASAMFLIGWEMAEQIWGGHGEER